MIVGTENEVYLCCLKLEWLKPSDDVILEGWRKGKFGGVESCEWVNEQV